MQSSELRRHCKRRLNALDRERASWFAHGRELSDTIMPRRGSFLDVRHRPDRGGKRNGRPLDSTAMLAARTLASGLMAGLTSPARPLSGINSKRIRCAPLSIAEIDRPTCLENAR